MNSFSKNVFDAELGDVILSLKNICKIYPSGEDVVQVLQNINLDIRQGEMVAIIGPSGSGKSTLMNVLGCLDNASLGNYFVSGTDVSMLSSDQLSEFRRNHFGFIFQRYHLLTSLTAVGNVEIPAIYSGISPAKRQEKAIKILSRLGMGNRIDHRPNQLSGGQQQRVSIARALVNDGEIILADEPTGALDQHSGQEVLKILDELHQEGRTIILVTHDSKVADRADRIIEISDGKIIRDEINSNKVPRPKSKNFEEENKDLLLQTKAKEEKIKKSSKNFFSFYEKNRIILDRLQSAFFMAFYSLKSHPLRTFLTMLGVIIGIASVISIVALGNGATAKIMDNMKSLSSNTLTILPGSSISDKNANKITTLNEEDAFTLARQPYVMAASPNVDFTTTASVGSIDVNAQVSGLSAESFDILGIEITEGHFFDKESEINRQQDVVMQENGIKILFPDSKESPINKTLLLGKVMVRIVGIYKPDYEANDTRVGFYMPYTTAQTRFLGKTQVSNITVRIKDDLDSSLAQAAVTKFLTNRHGTKDFFILNSQEMRNRILETFHILTLFVSAIAVISLLVGGIGVMNIMLVTVSERVNEIGVRMAVGARRGDILQQFLIEAVVVCFLGGLIGIGLSIFVGWIAKLNGSSIPFMYTTTSILGAVLFSSMIGVIFGYLPARNASRLTPVAALARD